MVALITQTDRLAETVIYSQRICSLAVVVAVLHSALIMILILIDVVFIVEAGYVVERFKRHHRHLNFA